MLQEVSRAIGLGNYAGARSLLRQRAPAGVGSSGADPSMLSMVQAIVQAHLGHYAESRAHAQSCLKLCEEAGSQWGLAMCYRTLGFVALAEGAFAEAGQWLQQSIAICRHIRQRDDLGLGLAYLALASRGMGHLPEAWRYLEEALGIADTVKVNALQLVVVHVSALLLADQGEAASAVELHSLTSRYPAVANSKWFEDITAGHICNAVATLLPEALAAAQARGRARCLPEIVSELWAEFAGHAEHPLKLVTEV
jgi:tetratricopeptide (TPR) repeat protein